MSIEAANPKINATLTASAGSGKTWMLVTRIVRLLLDGVEPGSILALTFTRKAAAEMQQRLSERLYDMAVADDEQLNRLLTEIGLQANAQLQEHARRLYEMHQYCDYPVRTQTFHSFCQDILSRFALEADVPPNFDLLENSSLLIQQAQDALFNEAAKNMHGELAQNLQGLLDACGGIANMEKALEKFLHHRSDWWAYTEHQSHACEYAAEKLAAQLQLDSQNINIADIYNAFFNQKNIELIKNYAQLLAIHATQTNIAKADRLACALVEIKDKEKLFTAIQADFIKNNGEPYVLKDTAALRKKLGDDNTDTLLELHSIIPTRILETLDKIKTIKCWQLNRLWYLCGQRFIEHYQILKQELRLLDFVDLEWHSYKLLKDADNAQWIQYKLDQQIKHFLIDEFQDTNPTQWQLILPLLEEMAASDNQDRSVFLVGDEKQSIYSFRRAKPELQTLAKQWLQQNLNAKTFPLNKSWRSSSIIIDTVNAIFSQEKFKPLLKNFTEHETHQDNLYGRVILLPKVISPKTQKASKEIPSQLRNPLEQARAEKSSPYLLEGQQIADAIQQLIKQKTTTGTGTNCRLITYDDIYILVRKRSHVLYYEQALQAAGIPYIGANKGRFLECFEIQDMLALLDTLISPFNNLSLAHTLKSPIFNASDNDLMMLAEHKESTLWIERLADIVTKLDPQHALARAHIFLQEWRTLIDKIPVHDLLNRVYHQAQLLNRYKSASPASLQARIEANLIRFREMALELDSGRYPSLMHFLQYLRSLKSLADAPDEAPSEQAESRVKIMTIHASKGLEAAVVFLADTITEQRDKNSLNVLVEWPVNQEKPTNFQIIPQTANRDSYSKKCLQQQQHIQDREDANLFYVAVTRAKQYLYVSACTPEKNSCNDWYSDIETALKTKKTDTQEILCLQSDFEMPNAKEITTNTSKQNTVLDKRLLTPFNSQYRSRIIAPSQTGLHSNQEEQEAFYTNDDDALLRGIAIHRILELLNTHKNISDKTIIQIIANELHLAIDDPQIRAYLKESKTLISQANLEMIFNPHDTVKIFNELPLHYAKGMQMVYGIIDRLIVSTNEAWIIDYKSHQHATKNNIAQLAEPYQQQMIYYANGIQQAWPNKTVRASLLFTACGLVFDIDTSQLS